MEKFWPQLLKVIGLISDKHSQNFQEYVWRHIANRSKLAMLMILVNWWRFWKVFGDLLGLVILLL